MSPEEGSSSPRFSFCFPATFHSIMSCVAARSSISSNRPSQQRRRTTRVFPLLLFPDAGGPGAISDVDRQKAQHCPKHDKSVVATERKKSRGRHSMCWCSLTRRRQDEGGARRKSKRTSETRGISSAVSWVYIHGRGVMQGRASGCV